MKQLLLMLPIALLAACGQVATPPNSSTATSVSASSDQAPADIVEATAWAKIKATSILNSKSPALKTQMMDADFARHKLGTMVSSSVCEGVAANLNNTSIGASYSCSGRVLYMDY